MDAFVDRIILCVLYKLQIFIFKLIIVKPSLHVKNINSKFIKLLSVNLSHK